MNLAKTESATTTSTQGTAPLLRIRNLQAWYGESHILHGIDLDVAPGECITLLGRNGSGRSSTLKSIMGLVGRRTGEITFSGIDLTTLSPHRIARLGIGYCPEERAIFASLTAEENLLLPPVTGDQPMSMAEIYGMFPNLEERRNSPGTKLSGGEQQMLAIARILRTGARLLLLDEITEGLAPVIVRKLGEVVTELKRRGFTIIMVEQNFRFAAPLADRHYVLEHGNVIATITAAQLPSRIDWLHQTLGV